MSDIVYVGIGVICFILACGIMTHLTIKYGDKK